jgi:hypothetical protein
MEEICAKAEVAGHAKTDVNYSKADIAAKVSQIAYAEHASVFGADPNLARTIPKTMLGVWTVEVDMLVGRKAARAFP